MYLGTASGGLYRSEDGGRRWWRTSPGFPSDGMSLDDILMSPRATEFVGY